MMNIGAWQNGGTNIGAWQSGSAAAITADFSPAFVDATEFDIIEFRADITGGTPPYTTEWKDSDGVTRSRDNPALIEMLASDDGKAMTGIVSTDTVVDANLDYSEYVNEYGTQIVDSVTPSSIAVRGNSSNIYNVIRSVIPIVQNDFFIAFTLNGNRTGSNWVHAFWLQLNSENGVYIDQQQQGVCYVGINGAEPTYIFDINQHLNVEVYGSFSGDITVRVTQNAIEYEITKDVSADVTDVYYAFSTRGTSEVYLSNFSTDLLGSYREVVTSSDPITMSVFRFLQNTIIKDGACVDLYTAYKNKTRISLDMDRAIDSGGIVQWLDYGKETDDYTGSFHVETEEAQKIEQMICSGTADNMLITTPCENGFYLFGMGFSTGQNYTVNVSKSDVDGNVDIFGTARGYKFNFVASDTPYGDLVENTAVAGGIDEAWLLGGVDIPFSEWGNSLNTTGSVVQTFGGSSNTAMGSRNYGDIAKININCSEEQARRIIQYICKTMRGNTVIATLGDYHVFGRRSEEMTSCTCRLYSNILDIEQQGQNSVDIKFSLQMVGE